MKRIHKFLGSLIVIATIIWSYDYDTSLLSFQKEETSLTDFSIDNALYHIKNIAKKPHYTGSIEHKEVQKYIVNELKKLQLQPTIQKQTAFNKKWKVVTTVENIVTKIEGSTAGKAFLLLTHYDSNPHSSLGASDAGSGVATILEGVRAFLAQNKQPKNDIIILFTDAEELGLNGASAFVKEHEWAKDVGLIINFEARGSGGPSYMLLETNGGNKNLINEFIKANPNPTVANSLLYSVYKILPNDTDLTVFREEKGISGFNFAFIGDHFDYHTEQDTYERIDRSSLLHQASYFMSCIAYFSNSNLSNLSSEEDLVFFNFPTITLLTYPFSWALPLVLIALGFFILLIVVGLKKSKLTLNGMLKGFIPFFGALITSCLGSFLLWKFLLIIHPTYKDILHGFTYNGYQYIAAFSLATLWVLFKSYHYYKKEQPLDLFIAPILFGIAFNILIAKTLQGASFFIIPIYISLLILGIALFGKARKNTNAILFALLSIPTVYTISPMVKLFPVGLGLKMLFLSSFFITFIFGLLLPIFIEKERKSTWLFLTGFAACIFFIVATFNSSFSIDKKRPNSLVYIEKSDSKKSFWATYNQTFDEYITQVFDKDFTQENIPELVSESKYNTPYTYIKETDFKNIATSSIQIDIDTTFHDKRTVSLTITPRREINQYLFYSPNKLNFREFCINNINLVDKENYNADKGLFLTYHMSNSDKNLTVSFTVDKNTSLALLLNEISFDLLSNPKFNLTPRNEIMMPMPFVTNDAIITSQKINL